MFDKEAIQALSKADAINAAVNALDSAINGGDGAAALPEDFRIHDFEGYMPTRRRARGVMTTEALGDFATYTAAHAEAGATVFVDQNAMRATAVLNLGTPEKPGHADNCARYAPPYLAAYGAMLQLNGRPLSQQDAAEFLEDWPGYWSAIHDGEAMSNPGAVIAAVRNITIEALRKAESSVGQLSASNSLIDQIKATSGANKLPTHIYFKCVPYIGFNDRMFVLRLSIHTGEKAPSLKLRIVNREQHLEELGQELAEKVRQAIGDTLPVHLGAYTAAK